MASVIFWLLEIFLGLISNLCNSRIWYQKDMGILYEKEKDVGVDIDMVSERG